MTASSIQRAFDLNAHEYDRARRQLVPCVDEFYRSAVEELTFSPEAAVDVLEREFIEASGQFAEPN